MTQIVDGTSEHQVAAASQALKSGDLVAFPTETVYGLGANAAHAPAVKRIYEVKGRPQTDPLIVHVPTMVAAEQLIDVQKTTAEQLEVFRCLARAFWPGPLTLIVPAHLGRVCVEVTAGTGWVGLRQPAHPVAQRLLELSDCPVAAPSANLFGHVSPTTAEHVWVDFPHVDNLWIVDGGRCGFGIESTVARINSSGSVDVFRRGGVGPEELRQTLLNAGFAPSGESPLVSVVERYTVTTADVAEVAPGQLLVHYAPRLFTRMIALSVADDVQGVEKLVERARSEIVVLDFAGRLQLLKSKVKAYRDLSPTGDNREAVFSLFEALRWSEGQVPSSGELWIFDPQSVGRGSDELFLALQDRIFRAASGRRCAVVIKPDSDQVFVSAQ